VYESFCKAAPSGHADQAPGYFSVTWCCLAIICLFLVTSSKRLHFTAYHAPNTMAVTGMEMTQNIQKSFDIVSELSSSERPKNWHPKIVWPTGRSELVPDSAVVKKVHLLIQ
jgi:hypothetical protein